MGELSRSLWFLMKVVALTSLLLSLFSFLSFRKQGRMSLIEISSDADGASFHSASSGSVEVVDLPGGEGAAAEAAMRPPPPRLPAAANELTSARRATRVRVPAIVRSPPPPPPPRARRNRAAADLGGGGELPARVKRQSVEEGRRAGGAGNDAYDNDAYDDDEGAAAAAGAKKRRHLFRFSGGDSLPNSSLTSVSSFFTSKITGAGPARGGGGAPDIREDVDDLENLAAQVKGGGRRNEGR